MMVNGLEEKRKTQDKTLYFIVNRDDEISWPRLCTTSNDRHVCY